MEDAETVTSSLPTHAPAQDAHIQSVADHVPVVWYKDDTECRACLDRDGYTNIWAYVSDSLYHVEFVEWSWDTTAVVPKRTEEARAVVTHLQTFNQRGELPAWFTRVD